MTTTMPEHSTGSWSDRYYRGEIQASDVPPLDAVEQARVKAFLEDGSVLCDACGKPWTDQWHWTDRIRGHPEGLVRIGCTTSPERPAGFSKQSGVV